MLLGLAYQQRARETGDPSYYTKSRRRRSTARCGSTRTTRSPCSGLGSLALSRHRFALALKLGREAHALSPTTARNYGVIGDAEIELGRYRAGVPRLRHDEPAPAEPLLLLARLLRPRADRPHAPRAISAMKLAIDAATDTARADRLDARPARQALLQPRPHRRGASASSGSRTRSSRTTPTALDALAAARGRAGPPAAGDRVRAAGRRPDPAAAVRRRARRPLRRRRASPALAQRQYALIGAIERLLRANGVRVDLEIALFDVDHGIRLRARARARPDRPARAALDRRRRRARLGARAQRPLQRGAPLLEARAPARDAGRAKFFHRGDDRALPRPRADRAPVVPPRARAEPALLDALGAVAEEVRRMKRLRRRSSPLAALRRAGRRVGAPARQLHDQPLQRARRLRQPALRRLRPRPGRDPDVPGAPGGGIDAGAYARRIAAQRPPDGRRPGRAARAGRARARVPAGAGRPAHDAARGPPSSGPRLVRPERSTYRDEQLRRTGSAGRRSSSASAGATRSSAPTQLSDRCSLPEEPPAEPARHDARRPRPSRPARDRRPPPALLSASRSTSASAYARSPTPASPR